MKNDDIILNDGDSVEAQPGRTYRARDGGRFTLRLPSGVTLDTGPVKPWEGNVRVTIPPAKVPRTMFGRLWSRLFNRRK